MEIIAVDDFDSEELRLGNSEAPPMAHSDAA
jgi:hypothetical protein